MKARRQAVLALSALGHLAMVWAVLRVDPPPPSAGGDTPAMAVSLVTQAAAVALAATPPPPASEPPPSPAEDSPPPPPPPDVDPLYVDAPAVAAPALPQANQLSATARAVAAAARASGTTCHVEQWLRAALAGDPEVNSALATLPSESRSVAGAIMVWDGAWVIGRSSDPAGFAVIRMAVLEGVRAAPEPCRAELMRGPSLLPIPDRGDTTLLAIGSGEWRWDDLLAGSALVAARGY